MRACLATMAVFGLAGCRIHFDPVDSLGGESDGGNSDGGLVDVIAAAPPTFVQSANGQTTAMTTGQLTITPTLAGTLLVVVTVNIDQSTGTVTAVTDNVGDTFVSAGANWTCTGIAVGEIWYAVNGTGGASSISVTQATAARREIWAIEARGVRTTNPLVGALAADDVPQAATAASPALTPTAIPAFVVAAMNVAGGVIGFDMSTGFVRLGVLNGDEAAYSIGTVAGPYSSRWDAGGTIGGYCTATVAFAAGT